MAQFQFKGGLILDFQTAQYEILPDDPDFMEAYEAECKRAADTAKNLRNAKATSANIREACMAMKEAINAILGDGAVEEIFSARSGIGLYDLLDVFSYIQQEFEAYRKERQGNITPAPANREQRRVAKKVGAETA